MSALPLEVETEFAAPPPKRARRRPSDDLGERKTLMARSLPGEPPTIKELQRHAARFGSEQVVETAVELGYDFDAVVRLQDSCDTADLTLLREKRPHARLDKRASAEDRVRLLMGIEKEDGED